MTHLLNDNETEGKLALCKYFLRGSSNSRLFNISQCLTTRVKTNLVYTFNYVTLMGHKEL